MKKYTLFALMILIICKSAILASYNEIDNIYRLFYYTEDRDNNKTEIYDAI